MFDDAVSRIEALIQKSETQSHWFPVSWQEYPDLAGAKSEREEISFGVWGNVFISHSSFDQNTIAKLILPSVEEAANKRYFMLNTASYSRHRQGEFQHAMWVSGAMDGCNTVLLVVSANSRRSDWVKWECHTALAQNHPLIICKLDTAPLSAWSNDFERTLSLRTAPRKVLDFHSHPEKSLGQLLLLLRSIDYSVGTWKGRPLGIRNFLQER